jgi:hypothetical protein
MRDSHPGLMHSTFIIDLARRCCLLDEIHVLSEQLNSANGNWSRRAISKPKSRRCHLTGANAFKYFSLSVDIA